MKLPTNIKECDNKNKYIQKFGFEKKDIIFILMIIVAITLLFILLFKPTQDKPNINKYELVNFTNNENNKTYTDVITTENDDKYIKYIFIDENNSIQIDRIKDNYRTNIKLIETTNKPFIEIETIEKKELFVFDTSETIYTLHLPKEDIEKLKNKW